MQGSPARDNTRHRDRGSTVTVPLLRCNSRGAPYAVDSDDLAGVVHECEHVAAEARRLGHDDTDHGLGCDGGIHRGSTGTEDILGGLGG